MTPDQHWKIVPDETYPSLITFTNKEYALESAVKWDGCTHLWFTEEGEEECYHHICDLAGFIATLQALHDQALAYFDGEFGVGLLRDDEHVQKLAEYALKENVNE